MPLANGSNVLRNYFLGGNANLGKRIIAKNLNNNGATELQVQAKVRARQSKN
jgi:hypothetical protein